MTIANKRIIVAGILGLVLVSTSFLVSRRSTIRSQHDASSATVATHQTQRKYIQTYDSNSDGVPNWQEALLDPDPTQASSTASSSYTMPDTLTAKFGIEFYKELVYAHNYGVLDKTKDAMVSQAVQSLDTQAQDQLYMPIDIKSMPADNAGTTTLHSYGNLVALIVVSHPVTVDNERTILQEAMNDNDPKKLKELQPIHDAYADMVAQMLNTPVPEGYTKEHLDLLNAYNAILHDVTGMQDAFNDPLYALLRLRRYDDDVLGMRNAIKQLYNKLYLEDNVRFSGDDPTLQLVSFQ